MDECPFTILLLSTVASVNPDYGYSQVSVTVITIILCDLIK